MKKLHSTVRRFDDGNNKIIFTVPNTPSPSHLISNNFSGKSIIFSLTSSASSLSRSIFLVRSLVLSLSRSLPLPLSFSPSVPLYALLLPWLTFFFLIFNRQQSLRCVRQRFVSRLSHLVATFFFFFLVHIFFSVAYLCAKIHII